MTPDDAAEMRRLCDLIDRGVSALREADPDGEQHWTRPGKDRRDGTSATVGYAGSDVLKVFTSSHPHLDVDATYTKLGYLTATRFAGDHSAAASWLRSQGHHTPEPDIDGWLNGLPAPPPGPPGADTTPGDTFGHGWEPTDLHQVLAADYDPPRPTIGRRDGGGALFYPGHHDTHHHDHTDDHPRRTASDRYELF